MKILKATNRGLNSVLTVSGLKQVIRTEFLLEDGKIYNSDCPSNIKFAKNPALERMNFDRDFLESVGVSHAEFDDSLDYVMKKAKRKIPNFRNN